MRVNLLFLCLLLPLRLHAVTVGQMQTLDVLRADAASGYAAASDPLTARSASAASFDAPSAMPFRVNTAAPVEFVPLEGSAVSISSQTQSEQDLLGRARTQAEGTEPAPPADLGPSYHFEGTRVPNLNVVTYRPVADAPGGPGPGTQPPPRGGGGLIAMLPKILLYGGIAATLAGIFLWPPLLFVGGAAIGGWGVLKLLSSRTG